MDKIIIVSTDKNSPFRPTKRYEFEHDRENELFSQDAQDQIERLLMMNYSFTVEFVTAEREAAAQFLNGIVMHAAGYPA